MDTKLYPNFGRPMVKHEQYTHKPEDVCRGLLKSLQALKCNKVDMFYLHGPDRTTPFEDTLHEVNNLHEEGYFAQFCTSNYIPGRWLRSARYAKSTIGSSRLCSRASATHCSAVSRLGSSIASATTASMLC
jgi:aryl-alcohol dehydrogenase-like predicted oxidoreductase